MRFQDKVVIVTGAGSGIGEATALQFGQEGARVVCMDVRGAEETSEKINKSGGKAVAHIADVSKWPDWERVVEHTINSWGRVDALVAVAGVVSRHIDTVIDQNEAEWDRVININLKGVWFGMKAVLPHMIKNGGGKIVNISSLAVWTAFSSYTSSKGVGTRAPWVCEMMSDQCKGQDHQTHSRRRTPEMSVPMKATRWGD